jgi:hypothetical protein
MQCPQSGDGIPGRSIYQQFYILSPELHHIAIDIEKWFPYYFSMGKIYTGNGWILKVHGAEHPPVHVHLLHPDGKALLFLDGTAINAGVPPRIIAEAADGLPLTAPSSRQPGERWETLKRGNI